MVGRTNNVANTCRWRSEGYLTINLTPEIGVTLGGGVGDDNLVTRADSVVQVGVVVGTMVKLLLTSLTVQTMNNNNSRLLIY